MKNGALMTQFLNFCAELMRISDTEAWFEATEDDEPWTALLADGWTIPEIDVAYFRRFGVKVNRGDPHLGCGT